MMTQTHAGGVVARAACRGPVRTALLAVLSAGALHTAAAGQPRDGAGLLFPMLPPVGGHFAPAQADPGPWTMLKEAPGEVLDGPEHIRPTAYQPVHLDRTAMSALLRSSAREAEGVAVMQTEGAVKVSLPMPDGTIETFVVVESPVMEQELSDAYPEIKTYLGQGVSSPASTVRIHDTPQGFGAQIMGPDGVVCIDMLSSASDEHYASYRVRDTESARRFTCLTAGEDPLHALAQNGAGGDAATRRRGARADRSRASAWRWRRPASTRSSTAAARCRRRWRRS